MTPNLPPELNSVFESFPAEVREQLLACRQSVFEVAARHDIIGPISETLKWGQPSYLTPETKSGSTIRLGVPKEGGAALYAHCQTTIISDFRGLFPEEFTYEGNRAVCFGPGDDLKPEALSLLIRSALTYHRNK